MSLFEEASLVITPNGFKAGKLYAVKGADLDVTRATGANRINPSGANETMGANVPRIDYTGGGCPSILVEPQRTNSILNSATVATQTIASLAQVYTLSFYGSGTITLSGTHTATVVGLGTARKTYTFTPTAGNLILTVSGTCTNGQLEAGSYATSYIPTTSAIVTRNADVISKTGISSLIGQTEGTLYVEIKAIADDNVEKNITISDGTNANRINLFYGFYGTGKIYYEVRVANSVQGGSLNGDLSVTSMNKIACVYKTNRFELWINGNKVAQDLIGNTFSGSTLSKLETSSTNGSNRFFGNIKSIAIWKTALTDEQLATLTTI